MKGDYLQKQKPYLLVFNRVLCASFNLFVSSVITSVLLVLIFPAHPLIILIFVSLVSHLYFQRTFFTKMPTDCPLGISLCEFFWAGTKAQWYFHIMSLKSILGKKVITTELFAELYQILSVPTFEVSISQKDWLFVLWMYRVFFFK